MLHVLLSVTHISKNNVLFHQMPVIQGRNVVQHKNYPAAELVPGPTLSSFSTPLGHMGLIVHSLDETQVRFGFFTERTGWKGKSRKKGHS